MAAATLVQATCALLRASVSFRETPLVRLRQRVGDFENAVAGGSSAGVFYVEFVADLVVGELFAEGGLVREDVSVGVGVPLAEAFKRIQV